MSDEQRRTGEQPPTPEDQGHASAPQGPLERTPQPDAVSTPDPVDDPWLLDRVLSGGGGDQWSSLAELFAAASGPAEPDELRGERAAVHSFQAARAAAATSRAKQATAPGGRGARRVAVVSTLMAGKFAAVTVAGLVTLGAGGVAAAAYTGLLPAPLQDVAHRTIGAPMPDRTTLTPAPSATPSATPTTAAASPSRSHRSDPSTRTASVTQPVRTVAELCVDWRRQQLATTAPAFATLTQAASGATSLDAFCASLTTPTTEPTTAPSPTATVDPTATPSDTTSPSETPPASPTTASDEPSPPLMTASDQPAAPTQEPGAEPVDKPTGP
jgi:hypothetical protein